MLGGMRYAQKFFRINFKFYKFLLGSLRSKTLKIVLKIFHSPARLAWSFSSKFFKKKFRNMRFIW